MIQADNKNSHVRVDGNKVELIDDLVAAIECVAKVINTDDDEFVSERESLEFIFSEIKNRLLKDER